ncbi:hypothetical protein [Holospora curviuscula]|nr:hypothetical protein [Holospora curviuscula]
MMAKLFWMRFSFWVDKKEDTGSSSVFHSSCIEAREELLLTPALGQDGFEKLSVTRDSKILQKTQARQGQGVDYLDCSVQGLCNEIDKIFYRALFLFLFRDRFDINIRLIYILRCIPLFNKKI